MNSDPFSKKELIEKVFDLEVRLGRRPTKRDDNFLYLASRKVFGSWNNLMNAAGYETKFYQEINNFSFNNNFAYFLGLIVTDGHMKVHSKKRS